MNYINLSKPQPLVGSALIRSALLLAVGVFLLIAPSPDAAAFAELSGNFLTVGN